MPSNQEIKVLFITPEVYPLCNTGGLGDVSAALPAALRKLQTDVRLLLPGYPKVIAGVKYKSKIAEFNELLQFPSIKLLSARLSLSKSETIPVFVVDCPVLFDREGGPYMDISGHDWSDNALRFGLLSKIGAILASDASPIAWRPHIAHCNDWQSGLTPAYLNFHQGMKAATIMTIHNLAFQGIFPPENMVQLGLPKESFDIYGVEYHGNFSFLKAGLYYANHITTVSPNYAEEIQTEPLGSGMQGLLAARRRHLTGITNGIAIKDWNPATDPNLVKNYSRETIADKGVNKIALQQQMRLAVNIDIPLFAIVSRLSHQKGIDLLIEIASQLIEIPAQLVVLGNDQAELAHQLLQLAQSYPQAIAVHIGFNEALSHLVEAGADCFLMPSRFEPCGLNQMYSQHYGTIPVAHATGGLVDTVVDCTPATLENGSASGFLFAPVTSDSLLNAIKRAVYAYHDKKVWKRLQENGMAKDFSWNTSAAAYEEIYRSLITS